jgi:hypothetical protein
LSGIGCCFLYNSRNRKKLNEKKFQQRTTSLKRDLRVQEVQDKLMGYVDSVFPSVYQSKRWLSRLLSELGKHHRYMVLLMPTRDESMEKRRILTGVQLLTVQTMLMFLLAVACDIQVSIGKCLLFFFLLLTFFCLCLVLVSNGRWILWRPLDDD